MAVTKPVQMVTFCPTDLIPLVTSWIVASQLTTGANVGSDIGLDDEGVATTGLNVGDAVTVAAPVHFLGVIEDAV